MEARNRVGVGVSYTPAHQATSAGEIDSLESIPEAEFMKAQLHWGFWT
jgi:hypothetical protein